MQGHDLHAAGIGFQPQQLRLVVAVGAGDAPAQPVDQAMQAECMGLRFLQALGQLQVIAHAALAIEQAEQAFGIRRAHIADQGQRTTAQQALAPCHRVLLPVAVRIGIALECIDAACIDADQHGGQGRAQPPVIAGMQQGEQQRMQFARFAGGEQALLAGGDRGDADRGQGLLDQRRLAMRAHQHGDVAGPHRAHAVPVLARGRAGARLRQHGVDGGDAAPGRQLARLRCAVRPGHALRIEVGRQRCPPHDHRRRGCAVAQEIRIVALAAGFDHAERDARIDERRRIDLLRGECRLRIAIQGVDAGQQRRPRTEVVAQRRCRLGHLGGGKIGVHVAAAETVDRLLGVADQKQSGVAARLAEHRVEDRPLARVGVLELVDQGNAVLRAQLAGERRTVRRIQRIGHAFDQVVVGLQAALLLEGCQSRARVLADAVQQDGAAADAVLVLLAQGVKIGRDQGGARRLRYLRFLALVGLGAHRLAGQPCNALIQWRAEIARLAPRGQLPTQRLDPVFSIAVAVEHLAIDCRQQRIEEGLAMRAVRVGEHGTRRKQARGRVRRQWQGRWQQRRFAQQGLHVVGEGLVPRPQRRQVVRVAGILRMRAPQVGGEFGAQVAIVAQQFRRVEAMAGFQRMFAQHARAEAVDGEDRGEVDL